MASIDQLQIEIQAQDKATATLNSLTQSVQNLANAIDKLDSGKITSFARAMDKLSGIGANTNVTTKGIKDLASELSNSFGIRTKKGVDDLKKSILALYEVNKQEKQGLNTGDAYDSAVKGVQKAIEANYKYKVSIDETTKSVKDYVDATNKSGAKIGMADMKQEFGENFKEMASVLGGAFKNDLDSAKEGVQDLAEYLAEMNSQLGTNFDTQNVEKGFADLVETVRNAKEVVLDYKEASKQGLISDNDVFDGVVTAIEKVNELYREQEKYNATNGLGGIVGVLNQLGNINLPDLSSFVSAAKDIGTNALQVQDVSQGVKNIGDAATQATTQVEGLNDALRQSRIVIEGNEKVEHGFTMKDAPQYQNVEYPPMVIEQAQAFEEKLLPAIIDTENEISNLYQHMMSLSGVEAAYDAITEKFVEWKTQLMEMNGAISGDKWIVPEFSGNADFSRQQVGWISNIKPEVVEGYFYQIEDAANKCLPAIQNVGTTALALPDQFKTSTDYINQCLETMKGDVEGVGQSVPESFGKVEQGAKKAASDIEKATQAAREFKKVISDMESGKIDFDKDKFDAAVKGYAKASEAIKNYKDALTGVEKKQPKQIAKPAEMGNVLENVVALGEAFEKLGSKLNAVGDKGIKLFKTLTTPLRMAANEYKEKFEHMGEVVSNFQKNFRVHMDKMAQFWKRTMKTFTFMLVRKAITAIIKEVGNAVQSLAMYSNMMGTAFNTDISNMVADFQYLGRSIVSVFAPLINIIAPIIDAIVSKIATLLSYIGMIIAALGGKSSFTKAKKNVDNYAESLDSASKSAKNLTMGIDELNILSDQKSGSKKPYDGFADAWEEVDIPDWIKNLADKLKGLWDRFFDPLKAAWERAKQYVIDGFKTMLDSLKRLAWDILDDFLTMWNQEKTIRMFEQIFKIAGDIFRVIRNLADAFDEAWNKGKVGLHIFENLRDIAYKLVEHIRNVTYYMIGWAKEIDFSPLLQSFENLTKKLEKVADFIGGVFEDIMIEGVLKYIKFMIEDAVPHLQNTLADVFNAFDLATLRKNLKKIWSAFETMFENIHTGTTNAIGNLGKMVAKFTNSKTFTDFLQRLVDITKLITAERVEKVLTGIGTAILKVAESVIRFINSDAFMKFLEAIADWIDNHSVDQIAGILTNIANAILLFKFGGFVAEKLAGFFQFFSVITALKNLGTIASELTALGSALGKAGEGAGAAAVSGGKLAALSGAFSNLIPIVGSVVTAFLEFKNVSEAVQELANLFYGGEGSLDSALVKLISTVGIAGVAFTTLLGFPAGIIATGAVMAVASIKGIFDQVQEFNMDNIYDAILTKGQTTVDQVAEWYNQSTAIVTEHVEKWKNMERDMVQGRDDIDAYARSLEGLTAAIHGQGTVTSSVADTLVGKYEDLSNCINNYIDESTNALLDNILANRAYLTAQGYDVDTMILNLVNAAEEEKRIINDSTTNVKEKAKEYSDAVNQFGVDSDTAKAKYKEWVAAMDEATEAQGKWQSELGTIDTSEAVAKIQELGESLDLSQYGDGEEGWNNFVTNVQTRVGELKTTYETELSALNNSVEEKMAEYKRALDEGLLDEEAYRIQVEAITHQWQEDTNTLVTSYKGAMDFLDEQMVLKINSVAENAGAAWDNGNVNKMFYLDKEDYILSQMQTFVNETLGASGLEGYLREGYSALPEALRSDSIASMTQLVNDQYEAFEMANGENSDGALKSSAEVLQGIYDQLPGLMDYSMPTQQMSQDLYTAFVTKCGELSPDELAQVWGAVSSQGIFDSQQEFEDALSMVAGDGSRVFSDDYANGLQEKLAEIDIHQLGFEPGADFTQGFIDGAASKDAETKDFVEQFFMLLDSYVHDNTSMKFGSPNLKMIEYGQDFVFGFNQGIDENSSTTQAPIETWFKFIQGTITTEMQKVKELFNTQLKSMFSGEGLDVSSSIASLFTNVTAAITYQIQLLGSTMTGLLASFMETYVMPYFTVDIWQPLFDLFHEETLVPNFENFLIWFDEEAMAVWWEEHMLTWVDPELWDENIFNPLKENLEMHWNNFIEWWDKSIKEWWEKHLLKPWAQNNKWDTDIYNPIKKNMRDIHWVAFKKWWDDSIKDWWENHLLRPWCQDDKWDNDVYDPIKKNMRDVHWVAFLNWWDESLKDWWDNHVDPWVKLWNKTITELAEELIELTDQTFTLVRDIIKDRIDAAKDAVVDACDEMIPKLREVRDLICEIIAKALEARDLGIDIEVLFNGYASGGYVGTGDLFVANEAGPELIGTIGGRTAVASNNEITGIADAVYATGQQESQLLNQLISINRRILDKEQIVIGDKEIARMANNGQDQLGMVIIS